jgi:glycogen debranching enzyme
MGAPDHVDGLDEVLSPEGWAYASAPPVEPGDPGRFNALFGRDALITALQVLPARPDVARATLRALAALQGREADPEWDEEPGRIIHEHRPDVPGRPAALLDLAIAGRDMRYYGSSDATSWFLVVLDALGDPALTAELAGEAAAAAAWLAGALDRGGGLVRWHRRAPGGLAQQGWRDARDPHDPRGQGILDERGEAPEPPVADADTQAVAFAALHAVARLTADDTWRERAAALSARTSDAFDPDTMAVDAHDRRVGGAGSQLGQLLWAGVLRPDAAQAAAERLCAPDVLTPWGLRTLSSEHPQFDAYAYHRGSIWPFDSWLGWGGLRAAGREAEAERVRSGVLEALRRLGRAPELYAAGPDGPEPVAMANRVQAWTVGARWALQAGWDGRVSAP